ncbi:MAG: hypothetical protein JNL21_06580 [Myxococcales bacterium]|nr:hypothetical protein [Myxococcales bacterium]
MRARIEAAAALDTRVDAIGEAVAAACRDAAVALGQDPNAIAASATLEERLGWCDHARTATMGLASTITVETLCAVDLAGQAACEARCSGESGGCWATTLTDAAARCPDAIAGACAGTCAGACWGSVGASVDCFGACAGDCSGTCDGQASAGACDGACSGTCDGACSSDATAMAACAGTCAGSCAVALTNPSCTEPVSPPTTGPCAACPACIGLCEAVGAFGAQCRASVGVTGVPASEATVVRSLVEGLAAANEETERVVAGIQILVDAPCCGTDAATQCSAPALTSITASSERLAKVIEAAAKIQP